ncbi:molybdopterin-guanine dinucleotide biosynthesis protein B [Anaerobacillus sp. HL2]|nr:molybdopterin-guanine dinucleotide biosynthesis protein B [Anaerobacillus sp. HL2]
MVKEALKYYLCKRGASFHETKNYSSCIFSNSGKTTLVEKLISVFVNENYRVGTIKHHGHGGDLTSLDTGKDSWKHRQAGAIVSGAVSQGTLQLNVLRNEPWEAVELFINIRKVSLDVIFIEGFKNHLY